MTQNTDTLEALLEFATRLEEQAPAFLAGLECGIRLTEEHPAHGLTEDFGVHFCSGSASLNVLYRGLLEALELDPITLSNRATVPSEDADNREGVSSSELRELVDHICDEADMHYKSLHDAIDVLTTNIMQR